MKKLFPFIMPLLFLIFFLFNCTEDNQVRAFNSGEDITLEKHNASKKKLEELYQTGEREVSNSTGEFMGHEWYINKENNVVYWDNKPYVPYGFWGGSEEEGMRSGFKEFTLTISEGEDLMYRIRNRDITFAENNRKAKHLIKKITDHGGTYVINVGPEMKDLKTGRQISNLSNDDLFPYINRYVMDVTLYRGKTRDIEVTMAPFLKNELIKSYDTKAYLFDYDANTYKDISDKISSSSVDEKDGRNYGERREYERYESEGEERRENIFEERERESDRESEERGGKLVARFSDIKFPFSKKLTLVVLWKVRYRSINGAEPEMVGGAGGYVPMWNKKIVENTKKKWNELKSALKTESLRAINLFGGEVSLSRIFLVYPKQIHTRGEEAEYRLKKHLSRAVYPNYNDDPYTINEYRKWLEKKFRTISEFNSYAGSGYKEFEEVKWILPIRPNNYPEDESFSGLFKLFKSKEVEKRVDTLQNEFHHDLFGKWYGEYSKMAKKIFGDAPTFTNAADDGIFVEHYNKPAPVISLDVHIAALRHGVDGIGLSMYEGSKELVNIGEPSFWNSEGLINKYIDVQKTTGKTKFMWVYEGINSVRNAPEGGEWRLGPPNKPYLQSWLKILVERGVKGFFVGGIFPDIGFDKSWKVVKDKEWFSSLKSEVVTHAVNTKTITMSSESTIAIHEEKSDFSEKREGEEERRESFEREFEPEREGIDAYEAEFLARKHEKIREVIKNYPEVRVVSSFSEQYGVWIVDFFERDRRIAFATVNNEREVLEANISSE